MKSWVSPVGRAVGPWGLAAGAPGPPAGWWAAASWLWALSKGRGTARTARWWSFWRRGLFAGSCIFRGQSWAFASTARPQPPPNAPSPCPSSNTREEGCTTPRGLCLIKTLSLENDLYSILKSEHDCRMYNYILSSIFILWWCHFQRTEGQLQSKHFIHSCVVIGHDGQQ